MKKRLRIYKKNLLASYTGHVNISSILFDDRMEEPSDIWFSNISIHSSSSQSKWYEKDIGESNDNLVREIHICENNQASCSQGDIFEGGDNFKYIFTRLMGNGGLDVKLDFFKNTGVWAKAGLMLRESLEPNSRYIYIFTTPSINGVVIQKRGEKDVNPEFEIINHTTVEFPIYLRIERFEDEVSLSFASKEEEWIVSKKVPFKLTYELFIGLAMCSPGGNIYLNWYLSNFANLYCYKDFGKNLRLPFDFNSGSKDADYYSSCTHLRVQKIRFTLLEKMKCNLIELMISMVDDNNYIDLVLNEFFVPNGKGYNKYTFLHRNLIYGYDRLSESFDIVGYDSYGNIRYGSISFDDFEKSIKDMPYDEPVSFITPHDYLVYKFDQEILKQQLKDFINSVDSLSSLAMMRNPDPNIVYGVEVYDYLMKNLHYNDLRPLHVIYEHKKIMLIRLRYLKENKLINEKAYHQLNQGYRDLEQLALISRNMVIKNNLHPIEKFTERIKEYIDTIKSEEIKLISLLIDSMEKLSPAQ